MNGQLAIILAERLSMVATAAFLLARTRALGRIVSRDLTPRDKVFLSLVFGAVGILGTYAGIPVSGALANSRTVGTMVAGLVGGPAVGFAAGLIAGLHRYLVGGFTAASCGIAAVVEGLLAGWVRQRCSGRLVSGWAALLIGAVGESLQMLIILLTARPFEAAWQLVRVIGWPMIVVNSIGVAIFVVILATASEQQDRIAASQAQQTLSIVAQTLPYLRQGLSRTSAEAAARIILKSLPVTAVAFTDTREILAHLGTGSDHHRPGMPALTAVTPVALTTGEVQVAQSRAQIGCRYPGCRLGSAVVAPLRRGNTVIGALKLYYEREYSITPLDVELAQGLAALFSIQLELAEVENQMRLRAQAELKALQAQVHPHFLFNALNAIVSLIRTQPEKARELLIRLADFLRASLRNADRIPLRDELDHVDAYLAIERARFGPRLEVVQEIDPAVLDCLVPAFTLQPLVENAVKHGLRPKPHGGRVTISATGTAEEVTIVVADDGVGIDPTEVEKVLERGYGQGHGLGLAIVNERLRSLYGPEYALRLESAPGRGTRAIVRIPRQVTEGATAHAVYGHRGG